MTAPTAPFLAHRRPSWPAILALAIQLLAAGAGAAPGQEATGTGASQGLPSDVAGANEKGSEAAAWQEAIVVTATRSELAAEDVPLQVVVLEREEIELMPDLGLRELFQQMPSINMLSEESTLTAGPRDGGIAFRGLGGIAQSRSLVLVDGLPINDPFGSFVYWSSVPKDLVERIEVVPGAGGSWGNLALSGVVHLITATPTERTLSAKLKLGELDTREATLLYSDAGEAWSGWVTGNAMDSDGYISLAEPYRAPLDVENTSRYQTYSGKLGRSLSDAAALHLNARLYDEERERGTPLADDDSSENALSATLDLVMEGGSSWQVRAFGRDVGLREVEATPNRDRTVEILSGVLDVPSDSLGLAAVWFGSAASEHSLTGGADLLLSGIEATTLFDPSPDGLTQRIVTEGEQQFAGIFGQDLFRPSPRITVLFGARFDVLTTRDGTNVETDLETGQSTATILIDENTETAFNPSAGVVYEASAATRLRSSVYTGFRAPTPAELFVTAPSRNKNVANPRLEPERLRGAEAGVDYTPSRRFATRATGFWSEGRDLIERLLIGRGGPGGSVIEPCGFVAQGASCRQRQNLAEVRARGVEVEQSVRLDEHWRLVLSGVLLESEVTENPAAPALVGNQPLRTPEEAATLTLGYERPRLLSALARVTYVGDRWNDANNTELLESHTLVDLSVSHPLGARASVFAAVTNLLDDEYVIQYGNDGPDLGAPRMWSVGVRFALR